ncbi:MAG: S8 family serine peptidase [Bacteroidales bacterium]|nr:S8 family serine peptidase [Bacteroidales bacterium]MDY6405527.1 S8 family serine peptidase [Bacteroidales bacterium]
MLKLLILLNVFFVSFTDKPEKSAAALSPRAVEQRAKWDIPTDAMDYPVAHLYVDSLRRMGAKVFHTSRWFNGATIEMSDELASKVQALDFVDAVEMTRDNSESLYASKRRVITREETSDDPGIITEQQLGLYNLLPLHEAGFEGEGILMAVCDGGFYNANILTCFRQEQELGHFDFTDDAVDIYGHTGTHGTECLSTISGSTTIYKGAATKANYYLMRSEESKTESPKEMDNLVVALETADSLGVNVFSVSLGYAYFDNDKWSLNKNTDLDGKTTRVSRAATIAARKGMLVCVAAGNEGDNAWRTITAPADADSILTVGAVTTWGEIGNFSSYGPSSDGRIKPEVCAVGVWTQLINPGGNIVTSNGTSFATPLLAGLAASLWSALPDENAMQIRNRIIRSADRYLNPDTQQYGYGIPNAWKAYTMGPEGIEDVQTETNSCQKILRNGQIIILRNGIEYTISGQRVR